MLSVVVTVRPRGCSYTSPTSKSSKKRPRQPSLTAIPLPLVRWESQYSIHRSEPGLRLLAAWLMLTSVLVNHRRYVMNSGDSEPPAEVYRRYLESGGLGFQRCAGCGAAVFYPRVLCPVCGEFGLSAQAWGWSTRRRLCTG